MAGGFGQRKIARPVQRYELCLKGGVAAPALKAGTGVSRAMRVVLLLFYMALVSFIPVALYRCENGDECDAALR